MGKQLNDYTETIFFVVFFFEFIAKSIGMGFILGQGT